MKKPRKQRKTETDSRELVLAMLKDMGPMTRLDLVIALDRPYASVSRAVDYYAKRGRLMRGKKIRQCRMGRLAHLWALA